MLRNLDKIKFDLKNSDFVFSQHAFVRSIERDIGLSELFECVENLEIIEYYKDDKYSPSCLCLGFTILNRPVHIQISLDSSNILEVITLYEPTLDLWQENYKTRRYK